jgi:hypothetical protein
VERIACVPRHAGMLHFMGIADVFVVEIDLLDDE